MAPKSKAKPKAKALAKPIFLSTDELQAQHGELLSQSPYTECPSPFLLHKALHQRRPIIHVTVGVAKEWCKKYRVGAQQVGVSSAKELQDNYGDRVAAVVIVIIKHFAKIY